MDIKTLCVCERVSKKLIDASFFLPDEIVVQILSKVTDLKTLCICKGVSRRFCQIAIQVSGQVDTISLIAPSSWDTDYSKFREHVYSYAVLKRHRNSSKKKKQRHRNKNFYGTQTGRRFIYLDGGLINSMTNFKSLKSLYIKLPLSYFNQVPFLKWKVFLGSNRINSFVVLSPRSIHDTKGSSYDDHEKEERYLWFCHYDIARMYLEDAFVRYRMLFGLAHECPSLEKISITDSCKIGRISLSGEKLSMLRKSSTAPPKADEFHNELSCCRIPLLDLPVSGLVMKGVELVLFQDVWLPSEYKDDGYINIDDDFEDGEEAVYSEAVREIFKKHRNAIRPWKCRASNHDTYDGHDL